MKATALPPCPVLLIEDVPALDPVRVFLPQPERPGVCRIVIVCYDRAWSGYWGSIGERTPVEFLLDCHAEYLLGNLLCGNGLSQGKNHAAYLTRIIEAVQAALRGVQHAAG